MTSVPSRVIAWTLPRAKEGWPAIAFISGSCVAQSSANIRARGRVVVAGTVDRIRDPRFLQRRRSVGHDGGALWNSIENCLARSAKVVDDLNAEAVLFHSDHRLGQRLVIWESSEALFCVDEAHS